MFALPAEAVSPERAARRVWTGRGNQARRLPSLRKDGFSPLASWDMGATPRPWPDGPLPHLPFPFPAARRPARSIGA
ncbi:MAG: hypothetical protein DMG21_03645 [Acidobacteria bacterium]|nr:MAG: hypothetical protein DMG21_03645 [Acidobacteriota bacterium]